MIGAAAFFIAIIIFVLTAAVPSAILWILFILSRVHFTSSGGSPSTEDYGMMFRAFSLWSTLPGMVMFCGGIVQVIAAPFMSEKRAERKGEENTLI